MPSHSLPVDKMGDVRWLTMWIERVEKRVSKLKNCKVNKLKKRYGLLDKLWEIEGRKELA